MKPAAAMFYIMGAVVFIQLLSGGLRVFGFIDESTHITAGFITFGVAIVTLIVAAVTKPRFRPAIGIATVLVVLIFIQGLLGFDFLNSNSSDIIMVHYTNALLIFGAAIGGVSMAWRWDHAAAVTPPAKQ